MTKRKKPRIEAWATIDPNGRLYTVRADMDHAVEDISDNPLMRHYRTVRLIEAPAVEQGAEVRELRRLLAKGTHWCSNLSHTREEEHAWNEPCPVEAAIDAALKPRRTTKTRKSK